MNRILLKNCKIVNSGKIISGSILIEGNYIAKIFETTSPNILLENIEIHNLDGKFVMPGVIDDQVHFREPGLTHKATIYTESRAAVAGGVTSFMDMPNCNPQTVTQELLEEKYQKASESSLANYSFYIGATNTNVGELLKTNPKQVCGIKIFMGSSTGNMLVDKLETLEEIFSKCQSLIAVHCEDEETIRQNTMEAKAKFGENIPLEYHPKIRSHEACSKSSSFAIELARKHNTRLHILHLSTAEETNFFTNTIPLKNKRITSEVCVHHLWYNSGDYAKYGTKIKCNPAVKDEADRKALFEAMLDNRIDVIATDHAPHTWEEKQAENVMKAPSGVPLVQHSLLLMLEFWHQGKISLEKIVEKMCHAPAELFRIENRGYLKEGYFADIVVLDTQTKQIISKENIEYKCAWSPLEGEELHSKIFQTYVNGNLVYNNGEIIEENKGFRLTFGEF